MATHRLPTIYVEFVFSLHNCIYSMIDNIVYLIVRVCNGICLSVSPSDYAHVIFSNMALADFHVIQILNYLWGLVFLKRINDTNLVPNPFHYQTSLMISQNLFNKICL